MRSAHLFLMSCALATSSLACADGSDPGIVNDEDPLMSENGLSSNGLSSNGLTTNGLTTNGLTTNGLSSNGLSSNGLVMNALRDPSATGDLSRMFFRYLVSCALPANHSVTYTWTDSAGKAHTEINPGGLGLAPGWESSAATQADKEIVSACLGARTNSLGIPVPLSMRAENISALTVSSTERSTYTYGEGAFWGNLFASTPYMYSCSRVAFNSGANTSQYLSHGRTCTTQSCGIITPVGACYQSDLLGFTQACFDRDWSGSTKDWVSNCNPQKKSYYATSSNVITTWLLP
jgi:hypothetical protein